MQKFFIKGRAWILLVSRSEQECAVLLQDVERNFNLWEALAYLANMRIFWMLIVGLGEPSII